MAPMLRWVASIIATVYMAVGPAGAEADVKRGAAGYRACASCHSLEPGVHLTGPSLDALWGRRVASALDFPRYSAALRSQAFYWDATTLDAWLADPSAFVPDNYMAFPGIADAGARKDLVAFLQRAMQPGGGKAVVTEGLIPAALAQGQVPPSLSSAGDAARVTAIRHCHNTFFVVTADGAMRPIWETNLRLKVDTSANGPGHGRPVLVGSGMMGDRASIVFSDPKQISALIKTKC
jgi:cytochrome c